MPSAIESVYLSSVAWAELGSEVTVTPFGRLVAEPKNPGYRERNCVRKLRADVAPLEESYAEVGRHFAQLDLQCFHYNPALDQDSEAFRAFFEARGFQDAPALALVHSASLKGQPRPK